MVWIALRRDEVILRSFMKHEPLYESGPLLGALRTQLCPVCKTPMGDMPGSRDAVCKNCGFKDPCCE